MVNDNNDYVTSEKLDDKVDTLLIINDKTNERIDDLKSYISWAFTVMGIIFVIVQLGIGFLLFLLTNKP